MSKTILVLGAGMVSSPVIEYLHESTPYSLIVADKSQQCLAALPSGQPRIRSVCLDISEQHHVEEAVALSDLVISLLPYTFHPMVAEICIRHGKSLVTASYVGDAMRKLDADARERGVLLLNEVGLDPGIDHMEAKRIIDEVQKDQGRITAFTSFCGGLPAPEYNTNPLGYKFSWSPIGVLLAGLNPAKFLEAEKEVAVPPENLFENPRAIEVEGLGELDGYPNRDSIPYVDLYGIAGTRTMLRGTLRYPGWCPFLQAARGLGYLDRAESKALGSTYADFLRKRLNIGPAGDLRNALASHLGISSEHALARTFEWLGLMSDDPIPAETASGMEVLASRMQERLQYAKGERDMIVLQHRFEAEYPDGRAEEIISTLIDYGIPNGNSAMARTVGLPLAISARMVLDGRITETGVHIPIRETFYNPVLDELRNQNIVFRETRRRLDR